MIREAEVKKAFRLAYDVLDRCQVPDGTPEYHANVLQMFEESWKNNKDNELLKYLSIGICEWLGDIAKENRT